MIVCNIVISEYCLITHQQSFKVERCVTAAKWLQKKTRINGVSRLCESSALAKFMDSTFLRFPLSQQFLRRADPSFAS